MIRVSSADDKKKNMKKYPTVKVDGWIHFFTCINRLFAYCKATTLIFISECGSAISSAKEGKSGYIHILVNG